MADHWDTDATLGDHSVSTRSKQIIPSRSDETRLQVATAKGRSAAIIGQKIDRQESYAEIALPKVLLAELGNWFVSVSRLNQ